MKSGLGKAICIILPLACLALAARPPRESLLAEQAAKSVVFIVNKANPIDDMTSSDLRKLFTSERSSWPDGKKVTLVMLDQGKKERETILRNLYRMSESDYAKFVLQAAFTGNARNDPKVLADGAGVVTFVSLVPGAIGYASADQVGASVKVLKVDGRTPGAPGYKYSIP
jgi:ABC-type phosphate transport system substrate-binding protein